MNEIIPNLYLGELLDANFVSCRGDKDWVIITVTDYWLPMSMVSSAIFIRITKIERPEIRANMNALNKVAKLIDKLLKEGKKVLVHCGAGIERSPLCVAWYLHTKKKMTIADAYELIWLKRPSVLYRGDWLGKYEE